MSATPVPAFLPPGPAAFATAMAAGGPAPRFRSRACPDDTFEVVQLHGSEALAQPFSFSLLLRSRRHDLDGPALLRESAQLLLRPSDPRQPLPYHGVLASFEQLHTLDAFTLYRATLVPRLWRLGLSRRSRSFTTERSVPDTLRQLLLDSGLHDLRMRLRTSYRPRSFLLQYDESDLDFLHRWIQREGLFYLFEHDDHAERMLLVDHHALLPQTLLQPLHAHCRTHPDAYSPLPLALHDLHALHDPLPRTLTLHQRNFRKAAVPLRVHRQVCPDGFGHIDCDHLDFRNHDEGLRYARLIAEQLTCRARRFHARSTTQGLRCGQLLQLHHHPCDAFNRTYLVTRVEHHAQCASPELQHLDSSYACSLELLAHDTAFRPQPLTPWPRIPGTLAATVHAASDHAPSDNAPSDSADLDPHGRYSVRLHLDDGSPAQPCARLRMATPYAGSHHGMHMPLLPGTEVLVAFLDGDPDRPVITAAVPNSEHPSIVHHLNPYAHRIRTASGNSIRLDDHPGRQALWLGCPSHGTSIGLGTTNPQGDAGSGLWISTAGSHTRLVAGTSDSAHAGANNSAILGYQGALQATVANSLTIGGSIAWSAGKWATWMGGNSLAYSDGPRSVTAPRLELATDGATSFRAGLAAPAREALTKVRCVASGRALAASMQAAVPVLGMFADYRMATRDAASDPDDAAFTARRWLFPASVTLLSVAMSRGIRRQVERAQELTNDADASTLRLDADEVRLQHRSHVDSARHELRMHAQGTVLSTTRGDGSGGGSWAQDADTLCTQTSRTRLTLRQQPPELRASAAATALRIDERDLALSCGASGLRVGAARGVRILGQRETWQVEQTVWLA